MIPQKYIIAVSGGVDSVVLLHKLMAKKPDTITYIVAHFDHGIRNDSFKDAQFVESIAKKSQLVFELGEGKLGSAASEEQARIARYEFLREIKEKYKAEKIITAHHQDDFLETIVMNMLRGTGPRGLNPMQGQADLVRPLMNKTKQDILEYVKAHKLEWREDPSNEDNKYMRNYVRMKIMPEINEHRDTLLASARRVEELYEDIDIRIQHLLPPKNILNRSRFILYSYSVQREVIRAWLLRCGVEEISRQLIERVCVACKTLPRGKRIDAGTHLWLLSEKDNVLIVSK